MKKSISIFFILLITNLTFGQENRINHPKIEEDLDEIIIDVIRNYVYLDDKNVDINCVKEYYFNEIKNIKTEEETVLFFEYLLNEFYDSHLLLNTNRKSSFRLFAPIFTTLENNKLIVANVWQTQVENLNQNIVGAEILKFNGTDFQEAIIDFPTHCNDKNNIETKEWIANKILAGRYNEPRILTLKLVDNKVIEFNLDKVKIKKDNGLLTSKIVNGIGVIRINNSLGNDNLVTEFDKALNHLMNTNGIILDLRNTPNGGDSYEARGIMSRFITEKKPYQQHSFIEKSEGNPDIERNWIEYVIPRGETYTKPVIVLVGRWTGSMGEGLAIGFEGIGRAEIVGSEMERLAGEVFNFKFKHQKYGYKLSGAKLYNINGVLREKYVPTNYVKQSKTNKDETLEKGIDLILSNYQVSKIQIREQLELLGAKDQTLRLLLPGAEEKFGRGTEEYNYFWTLIHQQDSIVLNQVISIIDTFGWVGKNTVGEKANQALWLIIQHADLETQETYLPLLKESVKKGESEGWHLAYLEDRILMRNGKKQLYGTQAVWDNVLKKNKIYPTENIESVNERRKKLGLETLEDYAKANDYLLLINK
jgi:carboxyl-terminal processing protease